jgi:hypothetical protein
LTQALADVVGLLVALLTEELAVGWFFTAAGAYWLLVVEVRAASLAGTVVLAVVACALARRSRAKSHLLLHRFRKRH